MVDHPETAEPGLADSFAVKSESVGSESRKCESSALPKVVDMTLCNPSVTAESPPRLGGEEVAVSQRANASIAKCFAAVKPKEDLSAVDVGFCLVMCLCVSGLLFLLVLT